MIYEAADMRKRKENGRSKTRGKKKSTRIKNRNRFILSILLAGILLTVAGYFVTHMFFGRENSRVIGIDTSLGAPVTPGIDEEKANDKNEGYGKPLSDTIYVYDPEGRKLTVKMDGGAGEGYESTIHLPETVSKAGKGDIKKGKRIYQRVEVEYPDGWKNQMVSSWIMEISGSARTRGYESHKITVTAQNMEDLKLKARAACILDRETGQIYYNVNMDEKRNQASTTKIVTAVTVLEHEDDLSKGVTISKNAADTPYSYLHLAKGDKISYEGLLEMSLLASDNGAAVALAEGVAGSEEGFADMMEDVAKKAGCGVTCFQNPHGLDKRDHYSTAYEVALTLDYAMDNKKFRELVAEKKFHVKSIYVAPLTKKEIKEGYGGQKEGPDGEKLADGEYTGKNTNLLLGKEGVLGGKTGFTGIAGYCYAGAYEYEGREYITVIMGEQGEKNRWQDTKKLMRYIRERVAGVMSS